MSVPLFEIVDLHVATVANERIPANEVLAGVSLVVDEGEVHALISTDACGASALASALLGSPEYEVTSGAVRFRGDDITTWGTDVRAKAGIFLAFGRPPAIPGVDIVTLLGQASSARTGIEMSVLELRSALHDWMARLQIDDSLLERRSLRYQRLDQILQMAILQPEMAILDETESGLDVGTLRLVADGINEIHEERPRLGTLAITQHQCFLDHLRPDVVHVLIDGSLVASGGPELSTTLETEGYESCK